MTRAGRILVPLAVLLFLAVALLLMRDDQRGVREVHEPLLEQPAPSAPDGELPAPEVGPAERPGVADERRQDAEVDVSGRIRGRLIAAPGVEFAGARIRLQAAPPAFVGDVGQPELEPFAAIIAAVDGAGRFELAVADRRGYLDVDHPFLRVVAPHLVAAGPDEIEVAVVSAGAVRGRVVDDRGAGVADAKVRLHVAMDLAQITRDPARAASRQEMLTDGTGHFAFHGVPAEPQLRVEARPENRLPAAAQVAVVIGEWAELELVVGAGVALSGRVVDTRGSPVAAARVAVRRSQVLFANLQSGKPEVDQRETHTDAGGRFRIAGLSAGKFDITVRDSRFAPVTRNGVEVVPPSTALSDAIVLGDGAIIRGRIVDEAGVGVAGATVACVVGHKIMGFSSTMALAPKDAESMGGSLTKSAADGSFASPPLAAGDYDVIAAADGFVSGRKESIATGTDDVEVTLRRSCTLRGIVLSEQEGEPVTDFRIGLNRPLAMLDPASFIAGPTRHVIAADGTFVLEGIEPGTWRLTVLAARLAVHHSDPLELRAGEDRRGVIIMLKPESRITGLVLHQVTRAPIGGAHVTIRSGMDALRSDPLASLLDTTSADDGAFALRGLSAGRYQLSVTAVDFAPATSPRIELAENQAVDQQVILMMPGATLTGTVADAEGRPESGALIQAILLGNMLPAMATTDELGHYAIRGLAGGQYTVNKIGGSVAANPEDAMASVFSGLVTQSVTIPAGETVVLDIIGKRDGVKVRGRVSTAGEPLAQAFLSFLPTDGEGGGERMRMGTTDADGRYEVSGITPGEWSVTIQSGASFSDTRRESFDVTVPDVVELVRDFELEVTGISGTVRAADAPRPLGGVRVAVSALDGGVVVDALSRAAGSVRMSDVITGADGEWRTTGLRPGRYRVVAGGPGMFGIGGGYQPSEPIEVQVQPGLLTRGVDFRLVAGATLAGRVEDDRGHPVAGAGLFFLPLQGDDERHFAEVVSDQGGAYRADGLRPGGYRVAAKASGYAPTILPVVTVRQGETTERDITLRAGGELTLDLRDDQGLPVMGAAVRIIDSSGIDYSRFVSISDAMAGTVGSPIAGRYAIGPLPPGTYVAVIATATGSQNFDIQHGTADQQVLFELGK